jgi:hypothetical protein
VDHGLGNGWGRGTSLKARWNEENLPNFRRIAQKHISPMAEWTLWAPDWRGPDWSKPPTNLILPDKPTPSSNFCLLHFPQFSKQIPPISWVDPGGPWLKWATHKENVTRQTHPRSQFCLLHFFQFSKQIPPLGCVDPVGLGLGWAPKNTILPDRPIWGAAFVCWPLPNSLPFSRTRGKIVSSNVRQENASLDPISWWSCSKFR